VSLQESLSCAVSWLEDCQANHSVCARALKRGRGWYPTRLIDIGPPESEIWTVVLTNEIQGRQEFERYMSLSYRWGPNSHLLLLSDTIQKFRNGIPITNLPKTFQDFGLVARKLEVQYIWIDALCIIQDSLEDWNREALMMRQVYANSLCTVAATASADEHDGLFRHLRPESTMPASGVISSLFDSEPVIVYERDYWNEQISMGPLHRRGWVFQERQLSSRVLHFGRQLLWDCLEVARCETFPNKMPHHVSDKTLGQLDGYASSASEYDAKGGSRKVREVYYLWRNLVKNYVQCSFTKAEDKLIAFAGIAKAFQEATGDQYLAGLWRSCLAEGLDWRVDVPTTAALSYRAPSWSWASLDGPVRPQLPTATSEFPFETLDAKVTLTNDDPMSQVTGGHLTLRAFLLEGHCETASCEGKQTLWVESCPTQTQLHPDTTDDNDRTCQVVKFLPLHCFQVQDSLKSNDRITTVVCLWLGPTGCDNGTDGIPTYRRLGQFSTSDQGFLIKIGFLQNHNSVLVPYTTSNYCTLKLI
jgi:hypothetical protein